jgi:phosphotransferase system enzyme I (PtsI)
MPPGPSHLLKGIAVSHGVVVGPALVVSVGKAGFRRKRVPQERTEAEWARFGDAVTGVQTQLRDKMAAFEERRAEASILEAYLMMVGDETLAAGVREQIQQRRRCADWAVAEVTEALAQKLGSVDDPYIRERCHDIEFVGELLMRELAGEQTVSHASIDEPTVLVAHDLSPADTAGMVGQPVLAFVTEKGSRTSHTSIMARALEIPAVLGVQDALARIRTGDQLIVDGLRGTVIVNPNEAELEEAERRAMRYAAMAQQLGKDRDRPAATSDGVRVRLNANIELPDEAALAVEHGAEGVGLYRTEFLYVNRSLPPDEDEQHAIYERVITAMGGRSVTLRTFDIGGDKFATAFRVPQELNPMLGLRAVRLALSERDVFLTQLRAMVRASRTGKVRIMIPLVSSLDELRLVRELVEQAKREVAISHSYDDQLQLGVMIEVPAAAMMADRFAAEADFMSIGTNDLVQYALAIDRTNRALAYLASPYDPAILRLIARVIEAGREHGTSVSVCGEMASEHYGALVLIGLGVRMLSMESIAIPEIKEAMRRVSIGELEAIAQEALAMSTAVEVEQMLERVFEPRLHDLITGQPDSAPGSFRRPTPAFGSPRDFPGSPESAPASRPSNPGASPSGRGSGAD